MLQTDEEAVHVQEERRPGVWGASKKVQKQSRFHCERASAWIVSQLAVHERTKNTDHVVRHNSSLLRRNRK